jgi:heme exporter protein A
VWRGDRHVLRGVSLDARPGEAVHVAGANGAGKTTLLRVFAGLLTPEQGSITWQGRPIGADRDGYSAGIAYLAHGDGLKPELTAAENLWFEVGMRRRVTYAEIGASLDVVGLGASRNRLSSELSAGQRRRLALARVLLAEAPLWLLDEPFTHLDDAGTALVCELAARHLDAGGSIVMAAHQPPTIHAERTRTLRLS